MNVPRAVAGGNGSATSPSRFPRATQCASRHVRLEPPGRYDNARGEFQNDASTSEHSRGG